MYKLTDLYKQIKEEETSSSPQYKIYCDMDGVLVDFDEGYKALTGKPTNHSDVQDKNEFWNNFKQGLVDNKISPLNPTLLSAPTRDPQSRLGKRIWVKKNIPGTPLILAAAPMKKNYARKNAILIDDKISNINEWNEAGGIGILHTSTATTLDKLSKYGI